MYRTDQSQLGNQNENIPRNEITLSIDVENMLKSLQESMKKQQELENALKIMEQEKQELMSQNSKLQVQCQKTEAQKNILLEQINNLNKEVIQKQTLSSKCMSLEHKLKETENALKKMDSNLKSSENKRYSLSRKLEDKINENIENSKRLREQYCGSPKAFNRTDRVNFNEEVSQFEIFNDFAKILLKIIEDFKYPEYLSGLTIKDDKYLKNLSLVLKKYKQLSCCSFG